MTELLRTLASLWSAIAVQGEAAISIGCDDALLDAAQGLCEINGFFYKDRKSLAGEKLLAVTIVEQMAELLNIRKAPDGYKGDATCA